ncbi:MAG TPA: EAL domain-containing protein [Acetobacteraceae bacterium]
MSVVSPIQPPSLRQYSDDMPAGVPMPVPPARHRLLSDFARAMAADDQLTLVYQPRIALATGSCTSVEALIRWRHPALGDLNPGEFIPVVESEPLVAQLTDWVLNATMIFAARLLKAGHAIRVSANVSPTNLTVGYLAGRLIELLGVHDVPPAMLELEITEGALIGDDTRTRRQLIQIRRAGIAVAIDDFGAGYSNLRYFRQIPADVIKIDRSLVADIETDRASGTILRWLISLGHELGFRMVAEGLETQQARAMLTAWGCDEGQGYVLAKPMSGAELLSWLSSRHMDH